MAAMISQVELRISANGLRQHDTLSKSDPMAVVYLNGAEVGRTERIKNNHEPHFATAITVPYVFETEQKLVFKLYDVDHAGQSLGEQDFMGEAHCSLAQIVGASGSQRSMDLRRDGGGGGGGGGEAAAAAGGKTKKNKDGVITVAAEELGSSAPQDVYLNLYATKVDNKDFLGKSDPFLIFSRTNEAGSRMVVHKTEVIDNNLNPQWAPFKISAQALCHGNHDAPIHIECHDDDNGDSDLIGTCDVTLRQLQEPNFAIDLINEKKKAKKGKKYHNSGTLCVRSCRIETSHSFLEFVQGGCEINTTFAIDYTQSNGDPRDPRSLHFFNPAQPNQYQCAIGAVGGVIAPYDADQLFPVLGFGGRPQYVQIPPGDPHYTSYVHAGAEVAFDFPVNGNLGNPYCSGIGGVLQAYTSSLPRTTLWGPTNFAPVINHVGRFARAAADKGAQQYFVLLIITDGAITDMGKTKEAIVAASNLPISIIIVGVGSADFTSMEELDGDTGALTAVVNGRPVAASRDVVQFVPFNKYAHNPAQLAAEVLAEVPKQLTGYFKSKGIKPNPRRAGQMGVGGV